MKSRFLSHVVGCLLVLALAVSGCTPKETQNLLAPSEALGKVLAEEAAKAAGAKKQIVLINFDASWGPASLTEKAFKSALAKQGCSIVSVKSVSVGDPMKSGQVGLKAADFLAAIQQAPDAGAVVSLVGAPLLTGAAGLPSQYPPVLVVATASLGDAAGVASDRTTLSQMIEAKVIQLVIIDGPGAGDAGKDAEHQLFAQHFTVMRAGP